MIDSISKLAKNIMHMRRSVLDDLRFQISVTDCDGNEATLKSIGLDYRWLLKYSYLCTVYVG